MKVGSQNRRRERGYVLLTLMLFVALLTIGLLAMVENIESQIKRDREEELIHRGVQYSRAVRHYFKKFGRYPNRIEDLENTNNYRSLRKRYKDPITGKDFKPLHMTDVQMSFSGVIPGGGLIPGGVSSTVPGGLNAAAGGISPAALAGLQNQTPGNLQTSNPGDASSTDQAASPEGAASPNQPGSQQSSSNGAPQVFGGGAIVGVASTSKDKTIREFNKKDHYNQWQFIYDPTSDRGGLLMTPNQPPLQGYVPNSDPGHIVDPGTNGGQQTPTQNPGPGASSPAGGGGPQQPNPQPPDQ